MFATAHAYHIWYTAKFWDERIKQLGNTATELQKTLAESAKAFYLEKYKKNPQDFHGLTRLFVTEASV